MILSIIIPVYKVEKYVRKTLESVFSENFSDDDVEVIVVNDGTPDRSMDIVNEFASHKSLRIINQENQGLSGARNTGIKAAKGKYVWFVDSDDWIEPGFISRVMPLLKKDNVDIYMMLQRIINEDGSGERITSFKNMEKPSSIAAYKAIEQEMKGGAKITPMQEYIIRRQFILDNDLFFLPGIYHEDIEYAPRMLICADRLVMLPWIGYCYLVRMNGSITTDPALFKKRCISRMRIYESSERLEKSLPEGEKKRSIGMSKYRSAAFIFNYMSLSDIKAFGSEIGFIERLPDFKRDVKKNLFYDRRILHLGRHLIFLISPLLLKRIHKDM